VSDRVMPKRSWVTILASLAFFLLWQVLSFLRVEPNASLVRNMGFESWAETQAELPGATELLVVAIRFYSLSTMAFIVLATIVTLTAYRAGARWAWAALWIWPAVLVAKFVVDLTGFAAEEVGTFEVVFLQAAVPAAVGLLLGMRHVGRAAPRHKQPATG
jgi:hypothetical protein